MSDEINDRNRQMDENAETSEDTDLLLQYDRSFFGSYTHTVDTKGRLVIPQSFRENLGSSFCIAPSFDFRSVAIYPGIKWARLRKSYEKLGHMNPSLNLFLEQFDALSYRNQECDGQGRVLLPSEIRELILKNEHDVRITGANDHIRVVAVPGEKQRWDEFMKGLPDVLNVIGSLDPKEE